MRLRFEIDRKTIWSTLDKTVKIKMTKTAKLLCDAAKARFLSSPPRIGDRPIRRTGRLQNSLTWEVSEDGYTAWYGSNKPWRGESSVPYAVFIELGFWHWRAGRFVGPFPYLRPPLITKKAEVARIWEGEELAPQARPVLEVEYEK